MQITYSTNKKQPSLWSLHWHIAQPVRRFEAFWRNLSRIETLMLRNKLNRTPIPQPVYICGLARSGTTITLEILHRHPNVATHHYIDMVQPYLPCLWSRLHESLPLPKGAPQERPHHDGLMMRPGNPEAVEEIFWISGFAGRHDEHETHLLTAEQWRTDFNKFYCDQIKKLLIARKKNRYVTKNNYCVTRLQYLKRLFPDARFVVLVRDPRLHMISYLKQQRHLTALYRSDDRWWQIAKALGHYEFGPHLQFINCGDSALISEIRKLWDQKREIEAFGLYWKSIYQYLLNTIDASKVIGKSICIVRHEDLCTAPGKTMDRIIDHCNLDRTAFGAARRHFIDKLKPPAYYQAVLTDRENDILWAVAGDTARKFGYTRKPA